MVISFMGKLEDIIRDKISQGSITFHEFMQAALYHPALGYYMTEHPHIGKEGDYYTSPHLHRVFGAMIARQAIECWQILGSPQEFHIMECGPGQGWLAHDMLDYLKDKPMYDALEYHLVERNAHMQGRQKELLKDHISKAHWHSNMDGIDIKQGMVVSNELIDAMPVHLVQATDEGIMEVCVMLRDSKLNETLRPVSRPEILSYLSKYAGKLAAGYRTEVNLDARTWLQKVSTILKEGFVLSIDYGYPAAQYYNDERTSGTLLSFYEHKADENYYSNIGQRDLTAHVNFTAMADWGVEFGLLPMGFARQGTYLVSLGFDEVITELYGSPPSLGQDLIKLQGLIMPGTMGETHKVLMQYKGKGNPELRGFAMKNEVDKIYG